MLGNYCWATGYSMLFDWSPLDSSLAAAGSSLFFGDYC